MIRRQVLLTPELVDKVKRISQKQGLSQSKVVRELLVQALALGRSDRGWQKPKTANGIYDLDTFSLKNPRVDGFREIFSVGGKTTEIRIVGDEVFRHYLKTKKLPLGFRQQILKLGDELKELSETKKLVVRRAYVVPGLGNPPGPRFVGLKPKELAKAIKKVYDFALEQEYHLKKDSQIAAFFYPFADPKPIALPIKAGVVLPYGGYAVPLNKKASRVEVFTVWGNNEGVQSFDAIDRYLVDAERKIIDEKNIPQKTWMFCTTKKSQSERLPVPQDKQFEQVLSDGEILEVARVVKKLTEKYGLRRVEFSFDGRESIIFNESAPYEICEKKLGKIDKRGFVKIVSSEKDVEKLRKLSADEVNKTIVCIDKKVVEKRAYDVLNSVAGLSNKFTVLYPGLSATAHAMRVLNDFGHTAVVVGNRSFKEGEEIVVRIKDNQVQIDSLAKKGLRNYLVHLYDAKLYGRELVGGKALNLSLLKSKGFNVPHGSVLTTRFFDEVVGVTKNKPAEKFAGLDIKIPKNLWLKTIKKASFSTKKKYAVRSSANVEDQVEHAFAGQFKTFLNINQSQIEKKVIEVIKSTFSPRVNQYLSALDKAQPIKMAVIIQEMVGAEKSGVVFGKDIQTGNEDLIIIDAASGLAQGVVEGTAKTQRIVYSRNKDAVLLENIGEAKKLLSRMEIDSLVEMTLSVERLMDEPQDIEWAIDKKGGIWLLQSRRI